MSAPAVVGGGEVGSWELVAAAQAGDRDAFAQLYQQFHPGIARYVRHRVADAGDAEDVTSETFLRALDRISLVSAREGHDVGAWFVTIARNLVFDRQKSARIQRSRTIAEIHSDYEDAVMWAQPTPDPARRACQSDDRERARARLARWLPGLTDSEREVLWARFGTDLTVGEVAKQMGRTAGATKALTFRALAKLRAAAAEEKATEPSERAVAGMQRARRAVAGVHELPEPRRVDHDRAEDARAAAGSGVVGVGA